MTEDIGWEEHYATEAGHRMWPSEELVRWISGRRFDKALDAGAGTGSNLRLLAKHAKKIVAVEMDPTARDVLREKSQQLLMKLLGPQFLAALARGDRDELGRIGGELESCNVGIYDGVDIEIVDADVRSMPFNDGEFDLLVDCMTSQHIKWAEHGAVYREYARVLKPGGWLWLYHLDAKTSCERQHNASKPMTPPGYDWTHLSLFPTLDLFCLPPSHHLGGCVAEAGFTMDASIRGLAREYPNGDVAHYTIIAARKK